MTAKEAVQTLTIERNKALIDFYPDRREALDYAINLIRKEIKNEEENHLHSRENDRT